MHFLIGYFSHEGEEVIEHEGADLIAMASHNQTGLFQVFYGSVVASVGVLIAVVIILSKGKVAKEIES